MLLLFSLLLLLGAFSTKITVRLGIPVLLVFLGIGMLVGSDFLNLIYFEDAILAQKIANIALIFVLFESGFYTKRTSLRSAAGPSLSLATIGVLLTAVALGFAVHHFMKLDLAYSFLIGSIISSTDAAAVIMLMRQKPVQPRVSTTLEVESAANDPMAILLTTMMVEIVAGKTGDIPHFILKFSWLLGGGVLIGWIMSKAGRLFFNYLGSENRGYYYVLVLGFALAVFGIADVLMSSGIIAVFFCGYWFGNSEFVYKRGASHFIDGLSTISNMVIFLLLGLLVFPKTMFTMWKEGLILAVLIIFVARPLAVLICTFPFKFSARERLFIMWGGIKGAVPIVLATYPAAYGLANNDYVFDIVFFAVLLSCLVQGMSINLVADRLGLAIPRKPKALYSVELLTLNRTETDMLEVPIGSKGRARGKTLQDLNLPREIVVSSIVRGEEIVVPRGSTRFEEGDIVFVLSPAKMADLVEELLNGAEA